MATKTLAAWKKEAKAIAKKLGKTLELDDMTVEEVSKLAGELKQELEVKEAELAEVVEEKQPELKFEYSIAPGKCVTCKAGHKGMLHAGEEITAGMLSGGIDSLKALVKAGVVVHNK